MKRKTRVKPVNRKRRAKAFARAYGGTDRVEFVHALPCAVVGMFGYCGGPIECAHVVTGGMGRKADADRVIPLCAIHHHLLHELGRETFEDAMGCDLSVLASTTESLWQAHLASLTPAPLG